MTIQIPDQLARNLEPIAAASHKTVEELAIERLGTLVKAPETPADLLDAVRGMEHPSAAAVDDLDAAVAAARLPIRDAPPLEP